MDKKLAVGIFRRIKAKQKKALSTKNPFRISFQQNEFVEWVVEQYKKQEGKCHYCETSQEDINRLIRAKILTSKRFITRGKNLEVERLDSRDNSYSSANCVLVCYFCNNDKSDVITSEDYKMFFSESRKKYIKYLLQKLEAK